LWTALAAEFPPLCIPSQEARGDKIQTLLFSATLPSWVKQITSNYLVSRPQHTFIPRVAMMFVVMWLWVVCDHRELN
jgi:superfamily II DNA/RNA helicase